MYFLGIFKYWFGDNEEDNEEFTEVYNEEITGDFVEDFNEELAEDFNEELYEEMNYVFNILKVFTAKYEIKITKFTKFYKISIVFTKYYILMVHLNSLQ